MSLESSPKQKKSWMINSTFHAIHVCRMLPQTGATAYWYDITNIRSEQFTLTPQV